ncbi:MAG: IS21-like element helper ATPase IstB [Candidatus Binatia bacterium]
MARNRRTAASADDPRDELVQLAIDLDLTAAAAALHVLLAKAEKEGMSFTDFGLALFKTEAATRRQRKLARSLRRSRLGTVEGVEGFDWSRRPQLDARVVRELLGCRWVEERRNVACMGKPGLGKTRIAKALVHAACLAGYSTLCVNTADMIEDLHASLADGSYKRVFRRYTKPDVLLLDELAYEPLDTRGTTYLFRVIAARYQAGSIVLTANTGFSKWKNLFPSESQAVAAVDRLLHDATVLRFTGKTCRDPRDIYGAPLDDE